MAEALGLPASYSNTNSRSSLSVSDRSSFSHDDSDTISSVQNSLDAVVMKSPNIGSPADSSQESITAGDSAQPSLSLDGPTSSLSAEENDSSVHDLSSTSAADKLGEPNKPSDLTKNHVSIPMIEVSGDNDNTDEAKES